MSYTWRQNVQNNLGISQEKEIIDIQKMCGKVLKTHLHTQNA